MALPPRARWCLLAVLLNAACSASVSSRAVAERAAFDLDAARLIITEQNQRFTQAHIAGDIATIDGMFTPDAKSYPPGGAAVAGFPALHDFTAEYIKAGISEFREETMELYGNAEYLIDAGTYVVTYGPDRVTERGKYLNVWTSVDGTWKLKSNMWNMSEALPAAPGS